MRLVDKRWAGIAKGVGTQKIIGRVHMAQIQIKDVHLPSSFSILEHQPMDMLLGLDMLKRHQCCIDLKRNMLVFGSTGTETSFLSESELPECARLSVQGKDPAATAMDEDDKQMQEALAESAAAAATTTTAGSGAAAAGAPADSKRLKTDIKAEDKFTEENVQALMKLSLIHI